MPTIHEQLEWEQECLDRGSESYYANQDRLRDNGQADQTDAVSFIIKDRVLDAGEFLKESVSIKNSKPGVNGQYNALVRRIAGPTEDYVKLAYIGLKHVVASVLESKQKNTVMTMCMGIGVRIETELKCMVFEEKHPEYYDTVRKSFVKQNVTDFAHKRKVLMKKYEEFEVKWNGWSKGNQVKIGAQIFKAILNVFGDVFFMYMHYQQGKTIRKLDTTPEFDEWAAEFEKERGLLSPAYLPLKVVPRPWTSLHSGGYYTPRLSLKFIKTKGKDHSRFVRDKIPEQHIKAVNKLQRTAWQVNEEVLQVQEEIYQKGLGIGIPSNEKVPIPPFPHDLEDIPKDELTEAQKERIKNWKMTAKECYAQEQKRKGQVLAFMQGHKLAKELRTWDKLYFAYTCDFRGRIYCATSGLTPQGADTSKGLLRFSKKVVLGVSGVRWLAIHGANTFGEDKLTYDDRVQWIREHEPYIKQVVEDPISHRDFWGSADKPYQFLAFCYEWANCDYGRDINATGQLPVGLDGSCNGLQHFSAMLRDEVGAKATNLTQTEEPQDIYQEVADVTTEKLKKKVKQGDNLARVWLKVGVNRKCAKRPVMTLPYGATQQSARSYILEYVDDNWSKFGLPDEQKWEIAKYLTPILWAAIGEVVIAARATMAWMRTQVGKDYAKWVTPIGFPVYQIYKKVRTYRVATQLDGKIEFILRDMDNNGTPAKAAQKNGISPNFIHSVDSTHMVLTINNTDLSSYAMIHDDYGTHAGNTEHLYRRIREAFKYLYTEFSPLEDWATQINANLESIPKTGTYNINDILEAEYFFG
jgi:DNA-directed RNA polymerase